MWLQRHATRLVTRVPPMAALTVRIVTRANVPGNAAMLAYTALLALVPLVLLALFFISIALESTKAQATLLNDLQTMFPSAARGTLTGALGNVQGAKLSLGIGAALGGITTGVGLLSALDTALRSIYGYPARGWLEQKRWALKTLGLALLLVVALVTVPTLHAVIAGGVKSLPFGLEATGGLMIGVTTVLSHAVAFAVVCAVYHAVPPGRPPWRTTWPGAAVVVAMLSFISLVFPAYLARVSSLAHAGAVFSFIVVVLLWFYAVSAALLLGACLNAARAQAETPAD